MVDLTDVVGAAHLLTDPDVTAAFERDWTGVFFGRSSAVVRVGETDELAEVLRRCRAAGQAVVLQGGNTGLVAGATPRDGDVVVSLRRLRDLGDVDARGTVTVGAGATLAEVQSHVRAAGWDVGVDLAARDSATIGGMVATNAGGIHVVRHGSMAASVAGLEYVLADGTVIDRLDRPAKDNTGYDLVGQLAGSEGTLAAITRVRLRLVKPPQRRAAALLAFDSVDDAAALVAVARATYPDAMQAAEVMFAPGISLVSQHLGVARPFFQQYQVVLLLELGGRVDPTPQLAALGENADGVRDAAVAQDLAGLARLWRYREAHTEALAAAGPPVKLDVALPPTRLGASLAAIESAVASSAPGARVVYFGHVAEANMHVNVLGAGKGREQVTDAVLRVVAGLGGSISAEHGIGRVKVDWLPLCRTPAELAIMRGVKCAWDPAGVLAPGVLLPAD